MSEVKFNLSGQKMADMNVMNLIKKKGPKKLRGLAGAAAKKRDLLKQLYDVNDDANRKEQLQKILRTHQFGKFFLLSDNEMYENINTFVSTLSPVSDRQLIKMLSIVKNGIPWPLVRPFFKEFFKESTSVEKVKSPTNIILFFENYIKRPYIQEQIKEMKNVILSRQIEPLVLTGFEKRTETRNKSEIKVKNQRVADWDLPPAVRKPMFGNGDIPSKCEQEYRRAPWMYKFTNEPIRGFALKNEFPQYTTDILLQGSEDDSNPWYKANQRWYKEVCEKGRMFNEGNVAYVTATGDVIVESKEMYETSKKDWEYVIDIEFSPVNKQSFDVAKTLLKDNSILNRYDSKDIDAILSSISANVNYDMAKKLSWILVFLSKLTKEPQIYHYRVQNHQYKPENLILLDRYTLLPEIYKNPNANSDEIEYMLKSRRRFIENQFYSRLQPVEIGKRKRTSPARPEIFRYLTTDAISKCPPTIKDIIYYEEDGELYCFNRLELKTINPITGKNLSREFLDELARINVFNNQKIGPNSLNVDYDNVNILPEIIKEQQPDKELAPGLFQKLKDIIMSNDNDIMLQCSFCNIEVNDPKYKSIKGTAKVQFCDQECFDKFQF
jgi:hypothetical protein